MYTFDCPVCDAALIIETVSLVDQSMFAGKDIWIDIFHDFL